MTTLATGTIKKIARARPGGFVLGSKAKKHTEYGGVISDKLAKRIAEAEKNYKEGKVKTMSISEFRKYFFGDIKK